MIAHVIKNKIIPITGRFAVSGDNVSVSHWLTPISSFVRQDPSHVAAPVISMLPHSTPLVDTSLKSRILFPSVFVIKRIIHPKSGGIAVDQPFIVS